MRVRERGVSGSDTREKANPSFSLLDPLASRTQATSGMREAAAARAARTAMGDVGAAEACVDRIDGSSWVDALIESTAAAATREASVL